MKSRLLVKLDILHDLVLDDRADEVVESALDYLLCYERKKLERELVITDEQLRVFRERFGMNDRDFLRSYENAELDDLTEYLEWFALLSLESGLRQKLELVENALAMATAV